MKFLQVTLSERTSIRRDCKSCKFSSLHRMIVSSILIVILLATCYNIGLNGVVCTPTNGNSLDSVERESNGQHQQTSGDSSNSIGNGDSIGTTTATATTTTQNQGSNGTGSNINKVPLLSSSIKNVTAQNGQTVLLPCNWEQSTDFNVAWIRGTGNLELLSVDTKTVIPDERFKVLSGVSTSNGPQTVDWALQIRDVDKSTDSNLYMCQLNTDPPKSQYFRLNVVEPQVNIQGGPDIAVRLGDTINLTCVISQSPDNLHFIFWFKDDKVINFDVLNSPDKAKILVWKAQNKPGTVISNLKIFNSKQTDSANYTCQPSGARSTSIFVHVLEDNSDRRLVLFQNDNNYQQDFSQSSSSSAATSSTTNSALSVQPIKLSNSRLLALSIVFLIVQSWFNLVTQVQTGISLFLVAVIGWFLAKLTDQDRQELNHGHPSKNKRWIDHRSIDSLQLVTHTSPNVNNIIVSESSPLRRANSALNLLQTTQIEDTQRHHAVNSRTNTDIDGDQSSGHHSSFDLTDDPATLNITTCSNSLSRSCEPCHRNGWTQQTNERDIINKFESSPTFQQQRPKELSTVSANCDHRDSSDSNTSDHQSTCTYNSSIGSSVQETKNSPVRLIPKPGAYDEQLDEDETKPNEIDILGGHQVTALRALMDQLAPIDSSDSQHSHYSNPRIKDIKE